MSQVSTTYRDSPPEPAAPPTSALSKDTALPHGSEEAAPVEDSTPKEPEKPAAIRAIHTAEILDMILAELPPRAAISTKRVCSAFAKAVANNSHVEKKEFRHVYFRQGIKNVIAWDLAWYPAPDGITWEESGTMTWEEIAASDVPDSTEGALVPWEEILGRDWDAPSPQTVVSSRQEYTVTIGYAVDFAFIQVHALCVDPFREIPYDLWERTNQLVGAFDKKSCFVDIRFPVEVRLHHDCTQHPPQMSSNSPDHKQIRILAELNTDRSECWLNAIRDISSFPPTVLDAVRFGDYDSTLGVLSLRQNKCIYPLSDATLATHPVFQWLWTHSEEDS